jgi:methanogenic corrinoid protein MtbC1
VSDPDRAPSLPPVDPATASTVPASTLTPELLASLLADGDDELAAWTLRHALAEQPRIEVFDGLVNDAMTLVGERWASGRWSVAEEHLASQTLLRALERIRPAPRPESRVGPLAVLAALPGERHAIGLVLLDQVLTEAGWVVANLGADVPVEDLGRFIAKNEARLVALTAAHPERLEALAAAVSAVRAARPDVPILLGGRLATHPGIATSFDVAWSGTSLAEAVRFASTVEPPDARAASAEGPVS